jgi:hypothetical protein
MANKLAAAIFVHWGGGLFFLVESTCCMNASLGDVNNLKIMGDSQPGVLAHVCLTSTFAPISAEVDELFART